MLPDAYGCVVANRFENLLDDDADPFDLICEAETEERKSKDDEEKKDRRRKPGQRESQKDRRVPVASDAPDPVTVHRQQQRVCPSPVKESGDSREEAQKGAKRSPLGEGRANKEKSPQEFSIPKPSYNVDSNLRGRGGNRGRRGSRGGGGGYTRNPDNFTLRGKREYDRHNGTGISPEEKRGGRGPWNWGCAEDAVVESMEMTFDTPVKSEVPQTEAEEENQAMEEGVEMVVQVAMEMTLDEWKATQEFSRIKPEFNIRKAENKIPSKAKIIHQSKHLKNLETPEDAENDGTFLRRSANDITSLLNINFGSLGRPTRGGRGRGARGGPTSRPERPKPVMEREEDPAPNPDDPEDFPALSAGR